MQITGHSVHLESSHSLQTLDIHRKSVKYLSPETGPETVDVSELARARAEELREEEEEQIRDLELQLLLSILERLTGHAIDIMDPSDLELDKETADSLADTVRAARRAGSEPARIERETHIHGERESLRFSAKGMVKTEDGQNIQFDINLRMDRRLLRVEHSEQQFGEVFQDPLVLDLGLPAAALSGQTIDLDLDLDGTADALPKLGRGSGWIVHDIDSDGVVDDGTELFGPRTGDGFAELATLDHDGNGFIDAGDPAWSKLRVWNGNRLIALGSVGVGAIYTGSIDAPFTLTTGLSAPVAQQQEAGFWVGEHGQAGTVRRVDVRA